MFYCTGRSDNAIKNRWHLLQRLSKRKAKQQQIPIFRYFYTSSSTTTTTTPTATDINNSNYVDHNQQQQLQQQPQQQQSATLPAFQSIRPTIDVDDEHLHSICASASSSIPCSGFMMSDDDDITVLYTVFYFLYVLYCIT